MSCHKIPIATHDEAMARLSIHKAKWVGSPGHTSLHAYYCHKCSAWHLGRSNKGHRYAAATTHKTSHKKFKTFKRRHPKRLLR